MSKKNGKMKKLLAVAFACTAFAYHATACANPTNSSSLEGAEGYTLWGVAATEKILRDVDDSQYEALKTEAKIAVDTAKNEYEAAQVIVSADGAVNEYTVELSDLKLVGGEGTYSKDNISVYHMKYVNVTNTWNEGSRVGWYPDCVLPFAAAVEAGENKVSAGENQSVYFTFNTPETQTTGTYTGNVKLTVDGEVNTIPVSVRVRNATVNEANHVKSIFRNDFFMYIGEYNSTQEMYDTYSKFLMDYRVMPWKLVVDTSHDEEDAVYYAEKAYELCANEKCSTICLPVQKSTGTIPDGQLVMYIEAMMDKCLETGYNLLEKCYVYANDEPIQNDAYEKVVSFSKTFNAQREIAVDNLVKAKAANLEKYPSVTSEYYDELVEAVRNIRHVTTTKYLAEYEPYVDIFCPTFEGFDQGLSTGVYENDDKVWVYGALAPKVPYTAYHIDAPTLSPRLLGWLQALYNVEGNLYWATAYYAGRDQNAKYYYVDEYYENPNRYRNIPGEGYLLYPGSKYGIDGPIASLRLETIRDGYEEYELLYNIKEAYAAVSESIGVEFSAESTISSLMSSIHSGMRITATTDSFTAARSSLLDLSEFTQSGVCFTNYSDDGEGVIEYELYIPEGIEVSATGIAKISEKAVTGGKIVLYRADMSLSGAAQTATFSTAVNGETVSMSYNLSGAVTKYGAETLLGGLSGEHELVQAAEISGGAGQLVKLALPAQEENARARVEYSATELLSAIGGKTDKVVFKFWYAGADKTSVSVYVKYKNKRYEESISSAAFRLETGENVISWDNLTSVNWEKNGEIEYVAFEIGDLGAAARSDVYLKGCVLYAAKEDV
ncbi:MAG: DUF4091 domain-containing protein [Clostridia bacterium]|nr:DUF4091 domain-containing protein [Clostridia bacterium]